MAFASIIKRKRTGGGFVADGQKKIRVSRFNSKSHKDKPLCFMIGRDILKEMRWLKGDRIDILVDDNDNTCIMRRIQNGGLSLQLTKYNIGRVVVYGIKGDNPEEPTTLAHQIIDGEIIFDKCW